MGSCLIFPEGLGVGVIIGGGCTAGNHAICDNQNFSRARCLQGAQDIGRSLGSRVAQGKKSGSLSRIAIHAKLLEPIYGERAETHTACGSFCSSWTQHPSPSKSIPGYTAGQSQAPPCRRANTRGKGGGAASAAGAARRLTRSSRCAAVSWRVWFGRRVVEARLISNA